MAPFTITTNSTNCLSHYIVQNSEWRTLLKALVVSWRLIINTVLPLIPAPFEGLKYRQFTTPLEFVLKFNFNYEE